MKKLIAVLVITVMVFLCVYPAFAAVVPHELLTEDEERPNLDNMVYGNEKPFHMWWDELEEGDIYGFGGNPAKMTDGDTNSDNYAALGVGFPCWIAFEMDEEVYVDLVKFWNYYKDARNYDDIIIELSLNQDFSDPIQIFNTDQDNSMEMGVGTDPIGVICGELGYQIKFDKVKAKYIRVWQTADKDQAWPGVHVVEMQVFKAADQSDPPAPSTGDAGMLIYAICAGGAMIAGGAAYRIKRK